MPAKTGRLLFFITVHLTESVTSLSAFLIPICSDTGTFWDNKPLILLIFKPYFRRIYFILFLPTH